MLARFLALLLAVVGASSAAHAQGMGQFVPKGYTAMGRGIGITGLDSGSVVHLKSGYGVVADGTSDNTAAMNTAIAAANGAGGNMTFIVPQGTVKINSALSTITASGVWFKCEGAPGTCVFNGGANNLFTFSTLNFGGFDGVGFDNFGAATNSSVLLTTTGFITFNNVKLGTGVGTLVTLGAGGSAASNTLVTGLFGSPANVAVPLFSLVNGSGLFVERINVNSNNAQCAATAGRNFMNITGSWDTVSIQDSVVQTFRGVLNINAPAAVVQNFHIQGNWLDGTNDGIIVQATNGSLYGLHFQNNWIANCTSANLDLGGTLVSSVDIVGNRFGLSGTDGIKSAATTLRNVVIDGNVMIGTNSLAGANKGINLAGGATWRNITISDNQIGDPDSPVSQPQTGILTAAAIDALVLIGNNPQGSVARWSIASGNKNYIARGNVGLPDSISLNSGATPAGPTGTTNQIVQANTTANVSLLDSFAAASSYALRRADGTAAAPSAVQLTDIIGSIDAYGYGTNAYSSASRAGMQIESLENWTNTAQGTRLRWSTTPAGGTATAATMFLNNGTLTLGLGGTATGVVALAGVTSGAAQITAQSAAGTPVLLTPTTSGTLASNASSPITLNATTGAIGLDLSVTYNFTNTTEATSSTAAAVKTAGGLAVAKKIWGGSHLVMGASDPIITGVGISTIDSAATVAWYLGQSSGNNLNFVWNFNATPANATAQISTNGYSNAVDLDGSVLGLQRNSGGRVEIGKHMTTFGSAPTLSSCGTTPAIAGSDLAGEVTMGTGNPTGCVITFQAAYAAAPYCVVNWQATPLASQSWTVSTTAITLTQTATSSNKVNYVCIGRSGG